MSRLSFIEITYSPEERQFFEIISIYLASGWNLDDHGAISYLPLGAEDPSDWQRGSLEQEELIFNIIKENEKNGHIVGLVLMWKDSGIGCSTLFQRGGKLSFQLNVNRKLLTDKQLFTDVSWYLDRLLPPLNSLNLTILSVQWNEFI